MSLCLHPTLQTKAMLQHGTKAHESHTPYKRSKVVQYAIEMLHHPTKVVLHHAIWKKFASQQGDKYNDNLTMEAICNLHLQPVLKQTLP